MSRLAVLDSLRLGSLDAFLHGWVLRQRAPAITGPVLAITRSGSSPAVALALATIPPAVIFGRTRSPRQAIAEGAGMLSVLASGLVVRRALMWSFRRPRPAERNWVQHATGYAFPSGHSTNAALAAGLLIAADRSGRGGRRCGSRVVTAAGVTYAASVGISRVYLGVHWPTDVLAGWLLGVSWSLLGRRLLLGRQPEGRSWHTNLEPAGFGVMHPPARS